MKRFNINTRCAVETAIALAKTRGMTWEGLPRAKGVRWIDWIQRDGQRPTS